MVRLILLIASTFLLLSSAYCWDAEELELFDLAEEVNRNFYEVFGVEQTAASSAIRKAYHKLSLQYHPDKNSDANAEQTFRQLTGIYEVLKDEAKRKRYDELLLTGLPDWRQPVYYYRRAKKLSIVELSILLMLVLTLGHFAFLWTRYFERKFELSEVLRSKQKKDKRKKKAKSDDLDDEIENELKTQIDAQWLKLQWQAMRANKEEPLDEEDTSDETQRPKRRRVYDATTRVNNYSSTTSSSLSYSSQPVTYADNSTNSSSLNTSSSISGSNAEGSNDMQLKDMVWTEETYSQLIKAMSKYPVGTPQRWEKIATLLERPEKEIMEKVKELKKTRYIASSGNVSLQSSLATTNKLLGTEAGTVADESYVIDNRDSTSATAVDTDSNNRSADKGTLASNGVTSASAENVSNSSSVKVPPAAGDATLWSVQQQKKLEWALTNIAKGGSDRWERIAEHVPGKSKEACIARVKYLSELVRQKKAV